MPGGDGKPVMVEQRAPRPRHTALDVLLVDDDRDIRETIEQILEEEGYGIATAADGELALQHLAVGPLPRLILLDLMMPVMDGRAFLAEYKRLPRLAHIPVVIISSGHDARQEAATLGTAGYLAKPIELHLLLENVQRWVTR
jgi:CheY-like chemotaxis protein